MSFFFSDNSEVGIPSDFIAHYTMDNISGSTLVDEAGNYDGTITGAVTATGNDGDALYFDGTNDYVLINGIGLGMGSNFTIVHIIKYVAVPSAVEYYIALNADGQPVNNGFGVASNTTSGIRIVGRTTATGSFTTFATGTHPSAGSFLSQIVTQSSTSGKVLYVNGSTVASSGTTGITTLRDMLIAANVPPGTPTNYANITMDDIYVYDRVLTSDERAVFDALV